MGREQQLTAIGVCFWIVELFDNVRSQQRVQACFQLVDNQQSPKKRNACSIGWANLIKVRVPADSCSKGSQASLCGF